MSKFDYDFKDNELMIGVDSNEDGEKSLDVQVSLKEAIQEILKRGEKIDNAKLVDFELSLKGIRLALDTDQDGEKLLYINLNLAEVFDELGLFKG